jgi:hypothetical protein
VNGALGPDAGGVRRRGNDRSAAGTAPVPE